MIEYAGNCMIIAQSKNSQSNGRQVFEISAGSVELVCGQKARILYYLYRIPPIRLNVRGPMVALTRSYILVGHNHMLTQFL